MRGLLKLVCVMTVVACGGPKDTPPGPLSHHFDDMYIAAIPLDQKQSVVTTQNDWSVAKMENAKAEADLNETTTQLQVSRNDQKAAHLQVDSAMSQKKSAEASADTNRINNAQRDLHSAEEIQKAAEARVHYLEAYRDYMKKYARYTAENMYWREAQYEQAKAQTGKGNNIAPKGNDYEWYPKQVDERGKRTVKSKENAENGKSKAIAARQAWVEIQTLADKDSGKQTQAWDPMAPKGAPATAGNNPNNPTTPTGTNGTAGNGSGSATPQ